MAGLVVVALAPGGRAFSFGDALVEAYLGAWTRKRSTFCASKWRVATCNSTPGQYDIRAFSVPLFDLGSACY